MEDDRIIGCLPGETPASIVAGFRALQNARLNTALAAAQSRIEELEKLAYLGEHHFPDLTYKARFEEMVPQYRAAQSRIAELERMVVSAVNQGMWYEDGCETFIECDGTPASILAAVEKAMGPA